MSNSSLKEVGRRTKARSGADGHLPPSLVGLPLPLVTVTFHAQDFVRLWN